MKRCVICKLDKYESEFNKNRSRKDGLSNVCRECSSERSKKYYADNKEHHRKVVGKRNIKKRKEARHYLMSVLSKAKCADCSIADLRVLEFDHVRGKKFNNISTMIAGGYSVDMIKIEIAKCDIVCANCHRIRTFKRSPSYRNKKQ